MTSETVFQFIGGDSGQWRIKQMQPVIGKGLMKAQYLKIVPAVYDIPVTGQWVLTGIKSNIRYTNKSEKEALQKIQASLGRSEAGYAALIPIKKSEAWWNLAQDERREIIEEKSKHIAIGLKYLPAIARQLYHCRDIGGEFDFLTWFEFSPEHTNAFNELLALLRSTSEWEYVEREVDIRLVRGA